MGIITLVGGNSFTEISFNGVNDSASVTISLPSNQTTIGKWNVRGKSGTPVILTRSGENGQFSLVLQKPITFSDNIDWLSISNGIVSPENFAYVGDNSINGGNNTGFIFQTAIDDTIIYPITRTITLSGANSFSEMKFDGVNEQISLTIKLPTNQTTIGKWNVRGKSGTPVILTRSGENGQFSVSVENRILTTDEIDWINVNHGIATTPLGLLYIGLNSTDGGNTTGFGFDDAADVTITGANTFAEIVYPGASMPRGIKIRFPDETTTIGKWAINGTETNRVTLMRTGNTGRFTLDYVGFRNIVTGGLIIRNGRGLPAESWYVGLNSIDGGNNENFVFNWARVRFWVGGSGTWTQNGTTNWAYVSGQPGGAPAPTINDEAIFDELSSSSDYTVTLGVGARVKTIIIDPQTDKTLTLAGTDTFDIYGGLVFPETGFVNTFTGKMNFKAFTPSNFIDVKGQVITPNDIEFDGFNGNWTVISDMVAATDPGKAITFKMGSFNAEDVNITTRRLVVGFGTKEINLGSATVVLTNDNADVPAFDVQQTSLANLTFNGQNSHIVLSSNTPGTWDIAGGLQFADVTWAGTALTDIVIKGSNTFRNLTIAPKNSIGITNVTLHENQTITGILKTQDSNTDARRRLLVRSNIIGEKRRITAQTTQLNQTDFIDIEAAGSATWSSNTIGNRGGCSGINFPVARNVYWNLSGSRNWVDNGWANFPQGTPDPVYFPLPHDICVFTDGALIDTVTVDSRFPIGTLQTVSRNSPMTINLGQNIDVLGDLRLSPSVTFIGSGEMSLRGRRIQNILSANSVLTCDIRIDAPNTALRLDDDMTLSAGRTLRLIQGTLNLANRRLTADSVQAGGTQPRTLTMGTGTLRLRGSGIVWDAANRDGLQLDVANGVFQLVVPSNQTFAGGGLQYGVLEIVDDGGLEQKTVTITGENGFSLLRNVRVNNANSLKVIFPAYTELNRWGITGENGYMVTLAGVNDGPFALHKRNVGAAVSDYLILANSTATPTNTWYAGNHSVDNGGNSGWRFQFPVLSGFISFFDY